MGIEHRWGVRRPTDLDVIVDGRPSAFGRGRIRDMSLSGLRVNTTLKLSMDAFVTIVFVARAGGVSRIHRLKTVVTRLATGEAGLAFIDFNPHECEILRELTEDSHATRRSGEPSAQAVLRSGPWPVVERTGTEDRKHQSET